MSESHSSGTAFTLMTCHVFIYFAALTLYMHKVTEGNTLDKIHMFCSV
jgi:hypothetical protein